MKLLICCLFQLCVNKNNNPQVIKTKGKIRDLEEKLKSEGGQPMASPQTLTLTHNGIAKRRFLLFIMELLKTI